MSVTPISRSIVAAVILSAFLWGCGEVEPEPTASPSFTVRDSAGIEIVENHSPMGGEEGTRTIDPDPVVQIGVVEGQDPYQFRFIPRATRLPDGGFAVVDGGTMEVRVFDGTGRYLHTIGRSGAGPGEFTVSPVLEIARPDTLLAWDPLEGRLSRFLLDGTLVSERNLESVITELGFRPGLGGWHLAPDGTLVAIESPIYFGEPGSAVEARQHDVRIGIALSEGDRIVGLGTHPNGEEASGVAGAAMNPFYPQTFLALQSNPVRVSIVHSSQWEVRTYAGDGALHQIVRLAVPRTEITPAYVKRFRDNLRASYEARGANPAANLAAFDALTIPDSTLAVAGFHVDRSGTHYLRRWVDWPADLESDMYEIIRPDGRWIGTMNIPPELGAIRELGSEYLLTEWRDDLGVSYLRMYRIVKGGG